MESASMTQEWDRVERRKDNWTLIVKEYRPKIGFRYKDNKGTEYLFFGLVLADDDYYYGLMDNEGKVRLSTCVGALEHAYTELPGQGRCEGCDHVTPIRHVCRRLVCPERKE